MALRFRTIDGSDNNQAIPGLNQADTDFARIGPANFADGISEMTPGPNPREISNIVVAGGPDTHLQVDGVALSGMMYAWGQFIDHDMDLQRSRHGGHFGRGAAGRRVPGGWHHDSDHAGGDRSGDGCGRQPRDRHQHGDRLARRLAGVRIGCGDCGQPAHGRRAHGDVGGRQPADRHDRSGAGVRGRRHSGPGKSGPDRAPGPVRARAQLSGRPPAAGTSELERRPAVRDRQGHHRQRKWSTSPTTSSCRICWDRMPSRTIAATIPMSIRPSPRNSPERPSGSDTRWFPAISTP